MFRHTRDLLSILLALLISLSIIILSSTTVTNSQEVIDGNRKKCTYDESRVYDKQGIPYYNYGYRENKYIGLQRSPITIVNEATKFNNEYSTSANPKNETARQFFINNADWLVNNAVTKQHNASFSYATYEYTFPWPQYDLEPPWRDGMTQGRALDVLAKAYGHTGEKKYLDTAKLLLNSFFVEVKDGGVTYKSANDGWWFEHYADNRTAQEPKVLNAMIFSVLGLYEYYKSTQDPAAKYLFDQGIVALKTHLPIYDDNGKSLYDALGRTANTFYAPIQIRQLNQLYNLTGDPIFKQYHDRWGTDFILTQHNGKKIKDTYSDICINSRGLFSISIDPEAAEKVLNLIGKDDTHIWKTVNRAKLLESNDELTIVVNITNSGKIYNRAYMQTQLNVTEQEQQVQQRQQEIPLMLALNYVAESAEGKALFVLNIRDSKNDEVYFSTFLSATDSNQEDGKPLTESFVLPETLGNKAVEFRLYIITDEPGSHSLIVKEAKLLSGVPLKVSSIV